MKLNGYFIFFILAFHMSQYNLKRSLTTAITGDATSQVFGFTKQVVLAGGVVAGTNLG